MFGPNTQDYYRYLNESQSDPSNFRHSPAEFFGENLTEFARNFANNLPEALSSMRNPLESLDLDIPRIADFLHSALSSVVSRKQEEPQ